MNMSFKCILSFSLMSSCHPAARGFLRAASKKVRISHLLQLLVSYPRPSPLKWSSAAGSPQGSSGEESKDYKSHLSAHAHTCALHKNLSHIVPFAVSLLCD